MSSSEKCDFFHWKLDSRENWIQFYLNLVPNAWFCLKKWPSLELFMSIKCSPLQHNKSILALHLLNYFARFHQMFPNTTRSQSIILIPPLFLAPPLSPPFNLAQLEWWMKNWKATEIDSRSLSCSIFPLSLSHINSRLRKERREKWNNHIIKWESKSKKES